MSEEEKAIQVAAEHLRAYLSIAAKSIKHTPVVEDHGQTWIVRYELPPNTLGGAPVVEIRKSDCEILRVELHQ